MQVVYKKNLILYKYLVYHCWK